MKAVRASVSRLRLLDMLHIGHGPEDQPTKHADVPAAQESSTKVKKRGIGDRPLHGILLVGVPHMSHLDWQTSQCR